MNHFPGFIITFCLAVLFAMLGMDAPDHSMKVQMTFFAGSTCSFVTCVLILFEDVNSN